MKQFICMCSWLCTYKMHYGLCYAVVQGWYFLGAKWQGREADHWPQSSAKVKNDGPISPLTIWLMAWCLSMENCTFISTSHITRGTLKKGFHHSTIALKSYIAVPCSVYWARQHIILCYSLSSGIISDLAFDWLRNREAYLIKRRWTSLQLI
jgi:hypothetical protein